SKFKDSTRQIFDIFHIIAYSLSIIFFSILFGIHFTIRYTFHPVFSFYISLLFLGYILCDIGIVGSIFLSQLGELSIPAVKVLDIISSVTYSYLFPLVFFATLERLAATILVTRYESLRPWHLVIV
ncbi:hypothetical protein PMAYCL1PPCAC_21794, partial [Pristionchus mayeri]